MAEPIRIVQLCFECERELPEGHDSIYCDERCGRDSTSSISADDKYRDPPDTYWDDRIDRMRDEGY